MCRKTFVCIFIYILNIYVSMYVTCLRCILSQTILMCMHTCLLLVIPMHGVYRYVLVSKIEEHDMWYIKMLEGFRLSYMICNKEIFDILLTSLGDPYMFYINLSLIQSKSYWWFK